MEKMKIPLSMFRQNKFILFVILGINISIISCNNTNEKKNIKSEIQFVEIEHLIDKYPDDNSTIGNMKIYFQLEITNSTSRVIDISPLYKSVGGKLMEEIKPTLKLNVDTCYLNILLRRGFSLKNLGLVGIKHNDENFIIQPNSTKKMKCLLITNVYGISLEDAYKYYKSFLTSNFTINSVTDSNGLSKLIFKKSRQFDIILKLDSKRIKMNDTLSMNKINTKLYDTFLGESSHKWD